MEREYDIAIVNSPLTFSELIPTYAYQFQDVEIPKDSYKRYLALLEFMEENFNLIEEPHQFREEYINGYKKALAITRLWIDSLYVEGGGISEPSQTPSVTN